MACTIPSSTCRASSSTKQYKSSSLRISSINVCVGRLQVIASASTSNEKGDIANAIDKIFDVNLNGVLHTITPLVNRMRERKRGQIVLISSLAGFGPLSNMPFYAASKASIKALGEAMRGLLYRDHVHVNVVCPGTIRYRMNNSRIGRAVPFEVPIQEAVETIKAGLAKDKAVIAFPAPMTIFMYISQLMPAQMRHAMAGFGIFPAMLGYFKKHAYD